MKNISKLIIIISIIIIASCKSDQKISEETINKLLPGNWVLTEFIHEKKGIHQSAEDNSLSNAHTLTFTAENTFSEKFGYDGAENTGTWMISDEMHLIKQYNEKLKQSFTVLEINDDTLILLTVYGSEKNIYKRK
jgi:hypothetical protein